MRPFVMTETSGPETLLRRYFHAKDENRPHLLGDVFAPDAQLRIVNHSDNISFPAETAGTEAIADVLVRRFNQAHENVYSFYLDRPGPSDDAFACDWLVAMTEKESRKARIGCGRYEWVFGRAGTLRVTGLTITIEAMRLFEPASYQRIMGWMTQLEYPWTSREAVRHALPLDELGSLGTYLSRSSDCTDGRDFARSYASPPQ